MNLNEQLSNIRAIKDKVEDEILKRSGIVGVDIGYKEVNGQKTGELAIRIFVQKKHDVPVDQRIPTLRDRSRVVPRSDRACVFTKRFFA